MMYKVGREDKVRLQRISTLDTHMYISERKQ